MKLNIAMVEPRIPQNAGNVARTCAATGARLHLVGPMGFRIDDTKLKRAGLDYWHLLDITYYDDIWDFFSRFPNPGQEPMNKGTFPDTSGGNFYYFTTKARRLYTEPEYTDGACLVFGSETEGLPEALLYRNPGQCVRFPMIGGARSLNLSNSVAVGTYEVLRQWGFPELENYGQLTKYTWPD